MRNSIFDLENGGSTYTRGRLIHEQIRYLNSRGRHVRGVISWGRHDLFPKIVRLFNLRTGKKN